MKVTDGGIKSGSLGSMGLEISSGPSKIEHDPIMKIVTTNKIDMGEHLFIRESHGYIKDVPGIGYQCYRCCHQKLAAVVV